MKVIRSSFLTLAMCCGIFNIAQSENKQGQIGIRPPKLVVLISIDQYRADYATRFAPYYLPARDHAQLGGFRFLEETGAWYKDAHHNHVPTATGPGHATLMTGSEPMIDGIIGNEWLDRYTRKPVYCVSDETVQTVGGKSKPMSPKNLKVTTVGDELKMATNGKSKVVGISFKDRASILMAGHAADAVIWFDVATGNWVTSTFYAPSGKLPSWVSALNDRQIPSMADGKSWEPLLPSAAYQLTRLAPAEKPDPSGKVFSHAMAKSQKTTKQAFDGFTKSGFGQDFLFESVNAALDAEKLGQHDVPDILVINLATNDYVGHQFGPNSPEVMDISVRTDRLLSALFNRINKTLPGGIDEAAIVVTADHGVLPVPEEMDRTYHISAGRLLAPDVKSAISGYLRAKYGPGDWILGDGLYEQNFYLNQDTIAAKNLDPALIEQEAATAAGKVPGVFLAFTRTQLMTNQVPGWDWVKLALNGFNPSLGGDLMVFEAPGTLASAGTGTGHSSAWSYDTHVPILLRARGVRPGVYTERVHTSDIAPTLAMLLGIEAPSGSVGYILPGSSK